jgi:hypothetical protein
LSSSPEHPNAQIEQVIAVLHELGSEPCNAAGQVDDFLLLMQTAKRVSESSFAAGKQG